MSHDSPVMFPTTSMTFLAHLGIGLGLGIGYGSGFDWTSSSIPRTNSTWSSTFDSKYETLMETLSYAKVLGRMNLPSL